MSAAGMPPHLLALFAPRAPLEFHKRPKVKPSLQCSGVSGLMDLFEKTTPPKVEPFITPKEKQAARQGQNLEDFKEEREKHVKEYDPNGGSITNPTKDPYRTLFVGNLNYTTTEKKLKREMERFGGIRRIRMIHDHEGRPRGYAFVEFDDERGMREAYKSCDRLKLDDFRVIVDVERSRTVKDWLPRRLGGGKGHGRLALEKKVIILERRRNEEIARRAAFAPPAFSGGARGSGGRGDRGGGRPPMGGSRYSGGGSSGRFAERGGPRFSDNTRGGSDRGYDRGSSSRGGGGGQSSGPGGNIESRFGYAPLGAPPPRR